MKRKLCWLLATIILTGLAGCGLKGPLYSPPADKPKIQTTPSDNVGSKVPSVAEQQ